MCGGGTSQTSTVSIPPEVLENYRKVFARGEQIAQKPFQEYSKDPNAFVAGLTPTQQASLENINAIQGMASGDVASGQSMIGAGAGQGSQLQQASLGTGTEGQAVGSQLFGRSMGTSDAGLGAASQIYGQVMPQIGQASAVGQRYAGQAGDYLSGGTRNVGVGEFDTEKYMSPYLNQVVRAQQALQAEEAETQRSALKGQAIRSGAFGGDRAGIAQANLARQQSLANQANLSNILQQGFTQAQGVAGQQQQLGLSAEQANRAAQQYGAQQAAALGQQQYAQGLGSAQAMAGMGREMYGMSAQQAQIQQAAATGMFGQAAQVAALQQGAGNNLFNYGLQGGQGIANLGLANQQAQMQAAQAQMQMGQTQQQTDQAGKTALYNQFTQQQGFPYQQAQFLANLAMGTGALSGSTTTTQGSGGGFFSDRRMKDNAEKIGETFDGQPIYRYNYKGDNRTQIGLMAQDVEKHNPKAVGNSQGYKTLDYEKATDKAAKRGHFYNGGLVPAAMGGAVGPSNAYEGYARGGYAKGGYMKTTTEDGQDIYRDEEGRTLSPSDYTEMYGPDTDTERFYQEELGRPGTAEERAYWDDLIAKGASPDDVRAGIAGTDEGVGYDTKAGVTPGVYQGAGATTTTTPATTAAVTPAVATTTPAVATTTPAAATSTKAAVAPAKAGGIDPRINQLYQQYMFRDAEAGGAKYWQDILDRGGSFEDVKSGIMNSRERNLVNQAPLTYDATKFANYAAPVSNRYGSAAAPAGSYGSSFQPQPQQASGKGPSYGQPMGGYGQQFGGGYGQQMGGYGGGYGGYGMYQQPSQMSQFNQGYGQGYMGGYQPMQQASGKGVGPSSYQSNYGYSNPSSMGSAPPQASGKGPSSSGGSASGFRNGGRIGYAGGGHIDPNDLAALASQRMMELAPHAAGMPGQTMPGAQSYVSNKQLHVPKLVTSNVPPPRQQASGLGAAMAHAEQVEKLGGMFKKAGSFVPEGLKKAATEVKDRVVGSVSGTPDASSGPAAPAPSADAPAELYKPVSFEAGAGGEFYVPEYMPDLDYASGGLVPKYAMGGTLPYGGGPGGGGYIPEELLQPQQIQGLPRDNEQLKAAGAKATAGGSGGLGDVMKAGNLGYKLAPESLKTSIKSMLPGSTPTTPAAGLGAAAETAPIAAANAAAPATGGLGAALPGAAESAIVPGAIEATSGLGAAAAPAAELASLTAAAPAAEAAAALPALLGAGEAAALGSTAAAGLGSAATAASAAAPLAAAGAEGLTALLAFLPFLSDRRAKENIEPIGKTYDGQTIYRYNYKGDDATQIGLIAQEVEKRHKDAVGSSNGMKTVDYKRATEDAADRGHFYNGGVIPFRRGYADGMTVDEADLPAVGAQDVSRTSTDREAVKEIIRREAEAQGVPFSIALPIAQVESSLNPRAQAKTSSAGGLYQTIDSTFKEMGGTGSKYDPEQNARAGIRYIAQNLKALGAEGADATPGKAYLGHVLGTAGAKGVLSNPDLPLSETLLGYNKVVAANPFMAQFRTGQDALQWAEGKMAKASGEAPPRPPANIPSGAGPAADQAIAVAKQPSAVAAPKKDDGSFPVRPPATARGKEQDWSDFLTSKQFILPALTAIGTMGTTPTRDFGTALSAGLLGGVKSYQDLDKSLAELEQKREEIPKVTAETGEVKMRTRALEAGLYEREWIKGYGMFLVDKSNPRNIVQITDKDLKPIPGTGVEGRINEIPYTKDSARPDVDTTAPAAPGQSKISELITPKKPGETTVQKPTSATSWTPMTSVPEGYIPPDQIDIMKTDKGKALGALGAKTVEEQNRKAEAAYDKLYLLEEMDKQFKSLPSEGLLTSGAYAKERMEFARRVNTFAQILGGKQVFDPNDVAAMEAISKGTFNLGAALSRTIGSREPGIIVTQAVQANPGIESTSRAYERISAGLREAAKYEQDKNQFYSEYYSKFGHLDKAEKMFRDANPPKMYADRAILSTVPPEDSAAFATYAARETDAAKLEKAKGILDAKYGKGISDKLLGK